jgi:soluble lytic murein transglycosylase-like protein
LNDLYKRIWPWLQPALLASKLGVDVSLILAIMDRESNCGETLTPKGAAGVGDGGHGRGLMQIDDRAHPDLIALKLPDGSLAWENGPWNIKTGTLLLLAEIKAFTGDEDCAVAAYNAGRHAVRRRLAELAIPRDPTKIRSALDEITTGKDYVTDVMRRRRDIRKLLFPKKESTDA